MTFHIRFLVCVGMVLPAITLAWGAEADKRIDCVPETPWHLGVGPAGQPVGTVMKQEGWGHLPLEWLEFTDKTAGDFSLKVTVADGQAVGLLTGGSDRDLDNMTVFTLCRRSASQD